MKQLSVLIKPASSLCNMRCAYCFYADVASLRDVKSYGIMTEDTARRVIDNLFRDVEDGDTLTIAFQGGEPTMAGLPWFEDFVRRVAQKPCKAKIQYALQTNGLLLDDAWCAFLKRHNFLVGISIDASAAFHNKNRVDANHKGTHAAIMQAKRRLEQHGVEFNVLCVLTNELARSPGKVWKFLLEEGIRYVQFIPCLDELAADAPTPYALKPERFAGFYTALLPLWVAQLAKGNYISVKFFDDVVNLLAKGMVTACGMTGQCQAQYVVEADGGVYPCDFYVLDEYRVGSLADTTLRQMFDSEIMQRFLTTKRTPPALCQGCQYARVCGMGCKRMQHTVFFNPDYTYCGYKTFLDENLPALQDAVRRYVRG